MKRTDDFTLETKELLAKRVGMRCSNPDCRQPTSGPSTDPRKTVNVGVAAHITAASPGGPRFDPNLTSDERRHFDNGIWCCSTCGKLIDSDGARYSVDLLKTWKSTAEESARSEIESPRKCQATATPEETKSIEILLAERELLLHAAKHNNMIQTILSLTTPFAIALGPTRPYKDEEEILVFIEALKGLIDDGLVDGCFERAMKTYHLTHQGLKRANEVQNEVPLSERIARLESGVAGTIVKPYDEWRAFKKTLSEQCQHLNGLRKSDDFKIESRDHPTAGEVHYKDAVFVHFFEKNILEMHFGKIGGSVGNKRPEKEFQPLNNTNGTVNWCERANKTISYGSRQLADWCLGA